ncbi:MAG: hypothetical protein JNL19_07430 [Burkholderiales bacterium]|nr:hypothetical protein [Burkholderiales bacterium]
MADNYIDQPIGGADASRRLRLVNFAAQKGGLAPAHREAIRKLVDDVRGTVVDDIFVKGYAHNDMSVATQRAGDVAEEITSRANWLSPTISQSAVNAAPLRATRGGSDAYWRAVDVLVYQRKGNRPPPPLKNDVVPPMPGPKRHSDWEVYAEWGLSFNVAPMAMVSLNAYHFRRKAPHTGEGVWCGSVQFGAGQSIELAKLAKLARLVKAAGVVRLVSLLNHLPTKMPTPFKAAAIALIKQVAGQVTQSDPSYSDAPAVNPFAVSDLNGATASGSAVGGGALTRSWSSAALTVTQKMPQYELKMERSAGGVRPTWRMVGYHSVELLHEVDVGGWATNLPQLPSVSASFVGGPLIVFG